MKAVLIAGGVIQLMSALIHTYQGDYLNGKVSLMLGLVIMVILKLEEKN